MTVEPFLLAGNAAKPGTRSRVQIPLPDLPNGAPISLPVKVFHGVEEGPVVWISAAVHGDEINGVDIVRRIVPALEPTFMRGTVLVVPIVDVYGFNRGSRYLPDRRDLNRSFPGSARGSLASRVAHRFRVSIVERCDAGIDLHSAAVGRINLPQVRGVLKDPLFAELAHAFGAHVTMNSRTIDGSMRKLATTRGIPYLLFEGGAANQFDGLSTDVGAAGCLRALEHLGVIDDAPPRDIEPIVVAKGSWIRAPRSGVIEMQTYLGAMVTKGDVIAHISDTFGDDAAPIKASADGIVVGLAQNPLVHGGDAMVHIGRLPAIEA